MIQTLYDEGYVKKSKKLGDVITKVNLPKFDDQDEKQKPLKPTVKKLGDVEKQIDVARARGISTIEILRFDHLINNKLSVEDLTVKPVKSPLVKELEKHPTPSNYISLWKVS